MKDIQDYKKFWQNFMHINYIDNEDIFINDTCYYGESWHVKSKQGLRLFLETMVSDLQQTIEELK